MFGRWVKCKSCELQLFQYLYFEIKYARSTLEVCLCFLSTFVEYIISFVSKRFTQFSTLYHIIEFILILMKSFSSEQKKMLQNKFKHGWSALQLLDLFMVYERYFNWISIKTGNTLQFNICGMKTLEAFYIDYICTTQSCDCSS